MDFKEPLKVDFDFEFYRSQHERLIGRKWILNDLDYLMNSSVNGVLLVAETGFGKSAIVSHLICQNDHLLPGNWIYERIVSYHLCRYDSRKSRSPGLFVKSLAGSFSHHIPEFFNILKSNSFYESYFMQDECLKDPEGCFDFLIIQSLARLKEIQEIQIIIIDAIDECTEYGGLNILTLLQSRLKRLPSFVKFFITTRNTTSVTSVLRSLLYVYEQDSHNLNNRKDIEMVMQHKINKVKLSRNTFYNLKTKFKTSNLTLMISSASKFSRNNMLYLMYAFEVWIQNDSMALTKTPSSFEDFFQYNLERIFENSDRFEKVRGIFEVLCSATEPISDQEILQVAGIPKENHDEMWKFFGHEMSHFTSHINGKLAIAHMKLSRFLTDKKRKYEQFYVSEQNGNFKLAKFLLSKVKQQKSFDNIDLIQLAVYVSKSEDELLKKTFREYGQKYRKEFEDMFILQRAALTINSYQGMVILIETFGVEIENHVYNGNFSAAYLASAFGNHKTLKALLKHGKDTDFVKKSPEIVKATLGIDKFIERFGQYGYSLLNIASQKGHLEVVETLMKHGVNLSHTNSLGLNSFHLASQYGHIDVVRHFLNHSRDIFVSSFDHSLYISARNGHYNVVELLLYHGAKDNCIPCYGSQYWMEFHQTRQQTIKNNDDLKTFNYVFKDDRQFIRCETALEAAKQNGHDDVAELLISKFPNGLKCKESGGRTPVITAIEYRRYELLKQIMTEMIDAYFQNIAGKLLI